MNSDTKFLLQRIDKLEARLLSESQITRKEISDLQAFKNRTLGGALILSFVVSLIVSSIMKG